MDDFNIIYVGGESTRAKFVPFKMEGFTDLAAIIAAMPESYVEHGVWIVGHQFEYWLHSISNNAPAVHDQLLGRPVAILASLDVIGQQRGFMPMAFVAVMNDIPMMVFGVTNPDILNTESEYDDFATEVYMLAKMKLARLMTIQRLHELKNKYREIENEIERQTAMLKLL